MKKSVKIYISILAIFSLVFSAYMISGCGGNNLVKSGDVYRMTLENGMEVVLKENHASPMITSLIFVNAGSKYENKYNNGVTHLLEHLLFNGTATQSQDDIEHGVERHGGYINAFTRKEFTAYLVSMPNIYIDYGMATQADMLFNSIFPEEGLAKERGIVIEEIKMGDDAEGAPAEAFFEEKAMAGTPYEQPIIGYESTISNIPRAAIIDYYKRFYAPNNMTALIIGDFDSAEMANTVRSIFGRFPRVELPSPPKFENKSVAGRHVFRTHADTKSTYVNYSIEAPHFSNHEYFAFNLIEDYLSDSENSPLIRALKTGPSPLANTVSAYLDTKEELTRLNIEINCPVIAPVDSIIRLTDSVIMSLAGSPPEEKLIDGYKTTRRCNEIYMSEKLHYYGFTIAPLMAITGWDFFSKFQDNIDSVSVEDIKQAASDYLSEPAYIATVVMPETAESENVFSEQGPTDKEVKEYYASIEIPEHDLTAGQSFEMPDTGGVEEHEKRHASYLKEVFDNGLTIIIKSNPDSRVFALNVLGQNRSATEPEGKDGITDFVNRMIEKGTTGRDGATLASDLASIGANVTLYDNPWIPYDDRYTTRKFSFMKFETIDQFTERGIDIFSDMIMNPAFDPDEVENVRSQIFGLLARNSGSTYKSARDEYYAALFEGTAYAKPIEGSFITVKSITVDDLKNHFHRIYAPENMIITVGTNEAPEKVMAMLKDKFGQMAATGFIPIAAKKPEPFKGVKSAHEKMDKEQVYIYIGNLLPGAGSPDAPALKVANAVLSSRLQKHLREEKGWAYSVGSSVSTDKNFSWLICTMGTRAQNYKDARKGIIAEIEKMKTDPPSIEELEEAINGIWGSNLMARLSRINQAYYMGVNVYLGLGHTYDDTYISKIRDVTAERVTEVARKYFDTENYVVATAGNI